MTVIELYNKLCEIIPTSLLTLDTELELPESDYVYDGTAKEPKVKFNGETDLILGTDYTVSYVNNVNAGTASAIVTALDSGKCSGSVILNFAIAKAPISNAEITLKDDGAVTVTLGSKELACDTDYTLTVEKNEAAGVGLVRVKGIGNYTGEKTLSFELDDQDADGNGWFLRNAIWFIPTCVVALGAIAVGIYFLVLKKELVLALISKLLKLFKKFLNLFKKKQK